MEMIKMLLLDLSNCGTSGLLRVVYFFKIILDVLFILIPIALIVLLIIDFAKMDISGDEGTQKKKFKLAIKRIVYAVIVFFVPTIVSIFNAALGSLGVNYLSCYTDINIDAINTLAAEEEAIAEAKKVARLALLASKQAEEEETIRIKSYITGESIYVAKGNGCDGRVYYEDGFYYKPSSNDSGSAGTKGSADYGYNKYFYESLKSFIAAANKAGHNIVVSTGFGAWRSFEDQQWAYDCWDCQCCNEGNEAADPGYSNHGWGIASDLDYSNTTKYRCSLV